MLWHREKVRETREREMSLTITDLEGEKNGLMEEKVRLAKQLEELRQEKFPRPGVVSRPPLLHPRKWRKFAAPPLWIRAYCRRLIAWWSRD